MVARNMILAILLVSVLILSGCSSQPETKATEKKAEQLSIQDEPPKIQYKDVYYREIFDRDSAGHEFSNYVELVKNGKPSAEIRYDSSEGILKSVENLQKKISDRTVGSDKEVSISIYDDRSIDPSFKPSLKTNNNIISISSSATNILLEDLGKISPITDMAPDKKEIKIVSNPESSGKYIVVLRAYRMNDVNAVVDLFISRLTDKIAIVK